MGLDLKEYFYIIVIMIFGGLLIYERDRGEVIAAQKDAVAATKELVNNQKVEDLVQQRLAEAQATANSAKPTPPPKLVCHAPEASTSSVSSIPITGPEVSSRSPSGSEDQSGFDPAPAVQADADQAENQIKVLLAYIQSLKDAGVVK